MDSLNNFFDKANNKVQTLLPNLLGLTPPIKAKNHSGRYFGPDNDTGVSRTSMIDYTENPNPGQGQISPLIVVPPPIEDPEDRNLPGFTPIYYYTKEYETDKGKIRAIQFETEGVGAKSGYSLNLSRYKTGEKGNFVTSAQDFEYYRDKVSNDFLTNLQSQDNSRNWPGGEIPTNSFNLTSESERENFTGRNEPKPFLRGSHFSGGKGTPYENEDPVFFGFEIIIDAAHSPLFNGEILKFMEEIGGTPQKIINPEQRDWKRITTNTGSAEIFNRKPILDSFCFESMKYFKFKNDVGPYVVSPTFLDELSESARELFKNTFDMYGSVIEKKHYVKKVENLDKLVEANGPKAASGFVKYREDTIKISFYEDVTLSTGTLMNLYKLLAWSRQRGKHLIPDNLLKFDCEIIISEVRNMSRVRSAFNENFNLTTTQPGDQVAQNGSNAGAFFEPGGDPSSAALIDLIRFRPPQALDEDLQDLPLPEDESSAELTELIRFRPPQASDEDLQDLPLPEDGQSGSPLSSNGDASWPFKTIPQSEAQLNEIEITAEGGGGTGNLQSLDLRGIPTGDLNSTFPNLPLNTSIPGQHDKKEPPKASKNALQIIEDNLSRYRYKLFECQFHIPTLPHPTSIDLGSQLTSYDNHSIDISFKHSEMIFERFDYNNFRDLNLNNSDGFGKRNTSSDHGRYIPINNASEKPYGRESGESNEIGVKKDEITGNPSIEAGLGRVPIKGKDRWQYSSSVGPGVIDLYDRGVTQDPSTTTTYGSSVDNLGDAQKNQRRENFQRGLESAAKTLATSTKKVALNVGQQLLNDQFRLLNNTIDKVRNAYGLGRISPPTNVYAGVNPNQAALQTAIRNFGGDVASAFIDLIPNGFRK